MSLFRRKTIFHAEEALPDPEELKRRFRRRVLLLTFAGCLAVLTVPVAKDLQNDLRAHLGARKMAEKILDSRNIASAHRGPVSLQLESDNRSWRRTFHPAGGDCHSLLPNQQEVWATGTSWKLQVQTQGGESVSGRTICLHPTLGLFLDQTPLDEGKLLVTALREEEGGSLHEAAFLLVSQFGADIQMVSR